MFDELEQDKIQSFEPASQEPVAEPEKAVVTNETPAPKEENLNVRGLRLAKEKAEREASELKKYIESMSNQKAVVTNEQSVQKPIDDDFNVEDDSYIEAKYVKQLNRKLKEVEQKFEQATRNNMQNNAEMRLKADYPDIMDVVTENNIKDLQAVRPDIYENLMYNPDMYKRGKLMREMIKDHVLSEKYETQDKRLEENKTRPRSSASVPSQQADTPLTRVGDYDRRVLTPERIRQLQEQVKESKKYR